MCTSLQQFLTILSPWIIRFRESKKVLTCVTCLPQTQEGLGITVILAGRYGSPCQPSSFLGKGLWGVTIESEKLVSCKLVSLFSWVSLSTSTKTCQYFPLIYLRVYSLETIECSFFKCGLCSQLAHLLMLASPLDSSESMDKLFSIVKPLFPHLSIEDNNIFYFKGWLKEKAK